MSGFQKGWRFPVYFLNGSQESQNTALTGSGEEKFPSITIDLEWDYKRFYSIRE